MIYVYADHNGATQIAQEVLEEMILVLRDYYANPASIHFLGRIAKQKIQEAREQAASFLDVTPSEIIFTSGGTESNHLAIQGMLQARKNKRHIIISRVEHLSVKSLCEHLIKEQGYEVSEIGVDSKGELDLQELSETLREDTALVSLMAANHETGVSWDLEEISKIVKSRDIFFHVDAAIAASWMPLRPQKAMIDVLTLSGHKLHGPKGVGALYLRKGVRLSPLYYGGRQENSRRPGTENIGGIVGFGKAVDMLIHQQKEDIEYVRGLRDRFENELIKRVPECVRNGDVEHRVPNTSNVSFAYIEGEAILLSLSKVGICASSGSACTTGMVEPSYVLDAMGKPDALKHGSIRFSFSRYNTNEEIDYLLEKIPPVIEQLRELSPFWQKKRFKS